MDDAEEARFNEFVQGRSTAHLRTAYLLTGDWAAAEDLLQTTMAKVYLAWGRIDDRDNVDAYVRRVRVTTYSSWWRRAWRGERPTADLPERAGADPMAAADQRDRIRRALAELPKRQRAAVVLRHYDDLSEAETARGLARLRDVRAHADAKDSAAISPALTGGGQKGARP